MQNLPGGIAENDFPAVYGLIRQHRLISDMLQRSIFYISSWFYLLTIPCAILVFPDPARAEWQVFETKYLKIRYQTEAVLRAFDEEIKFKADGGSLFSSKKNTGTDKNEKLAARLDDLFEKVMLILDMQKPIKVKVNVYPTKDALQDAYFKIYKKNRGLRAWYIFEYNTIYVTVKDLTVGMMAHECAHAIVDHFFDIRPPRATAEILARYVDAHLNKEAKVY